MRALWWLTSCCLLVLLRVSRGYGDVDANNQRGSVTSLDWRKLDRRNAPHSRSDSPPPAPVDTIRRHSSIELARIVPQDTESSSSEGDGGSRDSLVRDETPRAEKEPLLHLQALGLGTPDGHPNGHNDVQTKSLSAKQTLLNILLGAKKTCPLPAAKYFKLRFSCPSAAASNSPSTSSHASSSSSSSPLNSRENQCDVELEIHRDDLASPSRMQRVVSADTLAAYLQQIRDRHAIVCSSNAQTAVRTFLRGPIAGMLFGMLVVAVIVMWNWMLQEVQNPSAHHVAHRKLIGHGLHSR